MKCAKTCLPDEEVEALVVVLPVDEADEADDAAGAADETATATALELALGSTGAAEDTALATGAVEETASAVVTTALALGAAPTAEEPNAKLPPAPKA
jgi:hypothetical protein